MSRTSPAGGSEVPIRCAKPGEDRSLAELHVAVWRATYKDHAPAEAHAQLGVERRHPYWATAVASQTTDQGVLVAEHGGEIIGVLSFGPSRHAAFEGRTEIKHLYVALPAQGKGVGQRLLSTFLEGDHRPWGMGVGLAVIRENGKARRFYKSLGGQEIGAFTDPGPLWRSDNVVVAWPARSE